MQNASRPAPLAGISVVALATNVPGPIAAARLRELGAGVTKIAPPQGDPLALVAAAWYRALTAECVVERCDLRESEARERMEALLASADLLITTLRRGALERLHLDWASLHARHPKLCHVAIVGEAAPNDDRAGHDLTYQVRAGLVTPPTLPRTLIGDMAAAERAVRAAVTLLYARERDGCGAREDVAIVDVAIAFGEPLRYGLTAPGGPLGGGLPTYDLYACSDGWIAFAALEPHFEQASRAMLGQDALDAASLRAAFARRTCAQWAALAAEYDVPLDVVERVPA